MQLRHPRPLTRQLKTAVLSLVALCSLVPWQALAICCKCTDATTSGSSFCLTDVSPDCSNLLLTNKKTNSSLTNVSCSSVVADANCKAISGGGASAECVGDPVTAASYVSAPLPSVASATPKPEVLTVVTAPQLNVPIPGLTFANNIPVYTANPTADIPFLAQYLSAVYNYLVGISVVVAAIMIVYGGFRYIIGSSLGDIKSSKKIIEDAVIGLILIFGCVTILYVLNPSTALQKSLSIGFIVPKETELFSRFGTASNPAGGPLAGNGHFTPKVCPRLGFPSGSGAFSRINAACSSADGSLGSLVNVIKTFKLEGLDNHGAIYVRGGSRGGKGLNIVGAQTDFMYGELVLDGDLTPEISSVCGTPPDFKNGACQTAIGNEYGSFVGGAAACNDLLATDCGYFVSQALACAKVPGQTGFASAYNVRTLALGKTPDPRIVKVNPAQMTADAASGKLKFGAIVYLDCAGHFFMYVGGQGLGYDVIETGQAGHASGRLGSTVTFPGYTTKGQAGDTFHYGMSVTPTIKAYMDGLDPKCDLYYENVF